MKNSKQRKSKSKTQQPTEEEIKKLLLEAGFVFVDKNARAFGMPENELHQGETLIFPEGSTRGIPVK